MGAVSGPLDVRPRGIALPTYPFERERFWVEAVRAPVVWDRRM